MNAALQRLVLLAVLAAALAAPAPESLAQDGTSRTRAHVMALASNANAGRATGSPGERRAADYIVSQLRRIGALPLQDKNDYRLPFEFAAGARDGGSSITVSSAPSDRRSQTFASPPDVQALSFSDEGTISGALVFAGYGIVVPQNQEIAYDSYASLDVKDKIVVVLRYFPEKAEPKTRSLLARYSELRYKAAAARQRGAKGMLVVTGPGSPNAGQLVPMTSDPAVAGSNIVALSVSAKVAQVLFAGAARTLEDVQRALDAGNPSVTGFEPPGRTVSLTAAVAREKRTAVNVVAYLPAATPAVSREKSWIALGAHYDHLGRGEVGNSLAGKEDAGHVHYGADDNASGAAAVLAIGEALASRPRSHHVLLAFWSGEEIGLLGSAAFIRAPPVPLDGLAAYLNFDMVGRMQDNKLIVQAAGTSPAWPRVLEQTNVVAGFDLTPQDDPYQPTDVATFNEAKVPSLNFFTGAHADYHRPTDTADKINYRDLDRVAAFGTAIVGRISNLAQAPAFAKVEQQATGRASRAGVRVFTGTIPDYAASARGLLVAGVIGGAPADKAGLQKGDVIIEIGGHGITNIYDYTYALETLKVGEPAKVVYTRDGERKETTLTPAARN